MKFNKKEIISIIIISIVIGTIIGGVFGFMFGKRAEYNNLKNTIEIINVYDDKNDSSIGHVIINWSPSEEVDDGHWSDTDEEDYEYYK